MIKASSCLQSSEQKVINSHVQNNKVVAHQVQNK